MKQPEHPHMPQQQQQPQPHTPPPDQWTLPRRRRHWYRTSPWTARRTLHAAGTTAVTCALGAGMAWLGGFNFDARGPEVAAYAATVLIAAAVAVMVVNGD